MHHQTWSPVEFPDRKAVPFQHYTIVSWCKVDIWDHLGMFKEFSHTFRCKVSGFRIQRSISGEAHRGCALKWFLACFPEVLAIDSKDIRAWLFHDMCGNIQLPCCLVFAVLQNGIPGLWMETTLMWQVNCIPADHLNQKGSAIIRVKLAAPSK